MYYGCLIRGQILNMLKNCHEYIRIYKYYYVWLRIQYGKLRTNFGCNEWCRIISVANPAPNPWMCDLDITWATVTCAHSFARNCQLPLLNDSRQYFTINLYERMLPNPPLGSDIEIFMWTPTSDITCLAVTWENVPSDKCSQQRIISACASVQSGQCLRCTL